MKVNKLFIKFTLFLTVISILIFIGIFFAAVQSSDVKQINEDNISFEADVDIAGLEFKVNSATLEVLTRKYPEMFNIIKQHVIIDNSLPDMKIKVSRGFKGFKEYLDNGSTRI